MWSLVGLGLALLIAIVAWRRSRSRGGFYDADVYGMTAFAHRRYALISLAFAACFGAAAAFRLETAGVIALALYALVAVFYATSFLRGASEDDA
ncbi:MAG TPA: hypothetical protein VNG31_06285 [Candidatus Baltobacteraceae bacterium]|nr:hypothetical protein [Candidatus Baltobacteraceae bacterium]